MASETQEMLVRWVRWSYPDGTNGSRVERVAVKVTWPGGKPPGDVPYALTTEWCMTTPVAEQQEAAHD